MKPDRIIPKIRSLNETEMEAIVECLIISEELQAKLHQLRGRMYTMSVEYNDLEEKISSYSQEAIAEKFELNRSHLSTFSSRVRERLIERSLLPDGSLKFI